MSRLFFAAARGARIENHRGLKQKYLWLPPFDDEALFRIHPEDEHLQYGPISTALRESAKRAPAYLHNWIYVATQYVGKDWGVPFLTYRTLKPAHRSLFLLILAEALADEGL